MATGRDLEFGVRLPMFGEEAGPGRFRTLATVAEDNGFDVVVGGDHVVFPEHVPATYPESPDGTPPAMIDPSANVYDPFETLSFVAGATDAIRVGTNVCVAPYRHPVVLAKNALTLASLAGGRFEFGVGAGWLETEFEVLDVPFGERGSRTDEFLALFERVCSAGETAFDGPHHSFQRTGFHPVPDGKPAVWIGGGSGAAFRRVAEFGDGWTVSWRTPDEIRSARGRILDAWDDYGRDGTPSIAVRHYLHVGDPPDGVDGEGLVGSAASVVDGLEEYVDAGVTRFLVTFRSSDLDEQVTQLRRIGEEVVPAV